MVENYDEYAVAIPTGKITTYIGFLNNSWPL
jgi:hypothetical protein